MKAEEIYKKVCQTLTIQMSQEEREALCWFLAHCCQGRDAEFTLEGNKQIPPEAKDAWHNFWDAMFGVEPDVDGNLTTSEVTV